MSSTIRLSHRLALAALSMAIATTLILGLTAVGERGGAGGFITPARLAIAVLFIVALPAMYFEGRRLSLPAVSFAAVCAAAFGVLAVGVGFLSHEGMAVSETLQTGLNVAFSAAIVWLALARMRGGERGPSRPSARGAGAPQAHRR